MLNTVAVFFCYFSFATNIPSADTATVCTSTVSLNGDAWRIARDSLNTGRQKEWFKQPPEFESRKTRVPWVIQDIFHDYHGVVWYWREFQASPEKKPTARNIIRFEAVDYAAEIWLNGISVGHHAGLETPFEVDVTKAIRHGQKNLLVVRVLNPDYFPIDDVSLKETASSLKHHPYTSNAVYNSGGITGDVKLLQVPAIRVTDIFVMPDWKTGKVTLQAEITHSGAKNINAPVIFRINDSRTGTLVLVKNENTRLQPGLNVIKVDLQVPAFKLWSPDNPYLYRVTASLAPQPSCTDEYSVRFGFRDFRFENGFYRLNGKRIFLIGCNFSTHYPATYSMPLYEDMLRRDVVNIKALGMNFVRIPFGCANPRVMDIYDELGILVHQEHYGSWQMGEFGGHQFERPASVKDSIMARFEKSISDVIRRDRNHPSIIMWGALNENKDGYVFRKAVELLPKLRKLDPTRLMILNSGRFDEIKEIGSMSSPGSDTWDVAESKLKDWHPYVWIPYSAKTLDMLSGKNHQSDQKIYISESGLCFPIDLPSELGDYQMWGKENADDARYFKRQYEKFMADWKRLDLSQCWTRPEDYIRDAYITASSIRETGEAAIRSNPSVVAYTPTNGVADYSMGESVATNFRRLKPELLGSLLLANSPVRWCVATEPHSIYSGSSLNIRVSFSNLDLMKPGTYPATIQVTGPDQKPVYTKKVNVVIPENADGKEAPFAQEILNETITIKGDAGKYHLLATLDKGATATGGKTEFFVTEPWQTSGIPKEVVLSGQDTALSLWLLKHGVKTTGLKEATSSKRHLIVLGGNKEQDSAVMISVAQHLARGSAVVFLTPESFKRRDDRTGWLPLAQRGRLEQMDDVAGYYRSDRWAKKHPLMEGIHTGGMLDYKYFRNLISLHAVSQEYTGRAKPAHTFSELSAPLVYPRETVSGSTRISHTYCSGVNLGIWNFGEGIFIVNTLNISANLNTDPAADRLLLNILNYAGRETLKPASRLPDGFANTLKQIGYTK